MKLDPTKTLKKRKEAGDGGLEMWTTESRTRSEFYQNLKKLRFKNKKIGSKKN